VLFKKLRITIVYLLLVNIHKQDKCLAFARTIDTPCVVLDPSISGEKYSELQNALPSAKIYYAVKANPENAILKVLDSLGSYFDVASRYEIDQLLAMGISADRLSYGNTIKKEVDIAYAHEKGITLFTSDSQSDVEKLARAAPGASVTFRLILHPRTEAAVPLTRKFGAEKGMVEELIVLAKKLGLNPVGVSFHVGSQQSDVYVWNEAIAEAKNVFETSARNGIQLSLLNLGGGLPAHYRDVAPEASEYAKKIVGYLHDAFGETLPELVIEPGRYIVGDAGVLSTEVVMVSHKGDNSPARWVYLDVGKFGGLMESLDEAIKYTLVVERPGGVVSAELGDVILAGPTCDSADILYEKFHYQLPIDLKAGDRIYILSAGAYTTSYSSIGFNGFPPLRSVVI
jgi:ornithine decarboxylase